MSNYFEEFRSLGSALEVNFKVFSSGGGLPSLPYRRAWILCEQRLRLLPTVFCLHFRSRM